MLNKWCHKCGSLVCTLEKGSKLKPGTKFYCAECVNKLEVRSSFDDMLKGFNGKG